jgi:hypothetical protein
VLIIIQIIVLIALAIAGNNALGLWGWILLFTFALSLFVIPAMLEKYVRRKVVLYSNKTVKLKRQLKQSH